MTDAGEGVTAWVPRLGALVEMDSERAASIRGLYELAAWLVDHPEVPTPSVRAAVPTFNVAGSYEHQRAAVDAVAAAVGATVEEPDPHGNRHYTVTHVFGGAGRYAVASVELVAWASTSEQRARYDAESSYRGSVQPDVPEVSEVSEVAVGVVGDGSASECSRWCDRSAVHHARGACARGGCGLCWVRPGRWLVAGRWGSGRCHDGRTDVLAGGQRPAPGRTAVGIAGRCGDVALGGAGRCWWLAALGRRADGGHGGAGGGQPRRRRRNGCCRVADVCGAGVAGAAYHADHGRGACVVVAGAGHRGSDRAGHVGAGGVLAVEFAGSAAQAGPRRAGDRRAGVGLGCVAGASARVLRKKATQVRPSLAEVSWWKRRRVALTELGVKIARVGWVEVWSSAEDHTITFGGPRKGKTQLMMNYAAGRAGRGDHHVDQDRHLRPHRRSPARASVARCGCSTRPA